MAKCRVCKERDAVATYRTKCLQCGRLYHRQWRAKNLEKSRRYSKKWYERHKNDDIYRNSHKQAPVRLKGRVEECRAMQATSFSSKPCEGCGKERTLYCEVADLWLCRECHLKYH